MEIVFFLTEILYQNMSIKLVKTKLLGMMIFSVWALDRERSIWEPCQQKPWLPSLSLVLLVRHIKGQADLLQQPGYAICLRSLFSIIKVAVMQLNADNYL